MKSKILANITPGEILEEDFLKPLSLSQYRLAKDIGVPARRINEIIKGQRAITADSALRLGPVFWDVRSVLAQPSVPLRPGSATGAPWQALAKRSQGSCCSLSKTA